MSFLSLLTISIHRNFEENTFQYSLGIRRLYVCVIRAGPGSGREFRPVAISSGYIFYNESFDHNLDHDAEFNTMLGIEANTVNIGFNDKSNITTTFSCPEVYKAYVKLLRI